MSKQGRSSVVEQRPFKPKVVGSIPTAPTNIFFIHNNLRLFEGPQGANLWSQFQALMERAEVDGILADAAEELNHYSGEFNARNLLLIRVKPNEIQVRGYKSEFRQLANAIRSGTTWEEYKRANRIFEAGDLSDALKRVVSRVLGRVKRKN
jgi:hypothetical protein